MCFYVNGYWTLEASRDWHLPVWEGSFSQRRCFVTGSILNSSAAAVPVFWVNAAPHGLLCLKYVLAVKVLHNDNICWLWCS